MPFLRAYRAEEAEAEPDGMLFVASTAGVKRDGIEIDQGKWRLDNYARNPVVLLSHDYMMPPIGTAEAYVEDGQLMARVKWDMADPRAAEVAGKYERGVMNAVSVGWDNVDDSGERVTRGADVAGHELLDISAVSVPGDPDALAARMLRALHEDVRTLTLADVWDQVADAEVEDLTGDDDDEADEDSSAGIAAEMVSVFTPGSDDDATRMRRYRALLPAYRHAGLTPPPFRTVAELDAMDARTWCGQWVSGELSRAGAVLSKRNSDDLREAMRLIQTVLKSAEKAKPDSEESERAAAETAALRAILGDIT